MSLRGGTCVLLLGNACVLVVCLDIHLDIVLFLSHAGEEDYLPANAIASATAAKEICRRGDHKRGIRRTANQTPAGCQCKVGHRLDPTRRNLCSASSD